ncbi:ABC transporter ATP-binding protein [Polynucleobacter bastaniensis]|uniref:ABC transporter ATP-binding protein n=1 Tax=Polynucleobacter bastaniensis TaxID=2081039 RepID=UPI001C0C28AA|nr:ABC transporter ATP-binding protein [Polynucleobacter bastaniensis]
MIIFSSFVEIVSIGSALPFLGALTMPEKVFHAAAAKPFIKAIGLSSPQQLLLPLTIFFCLAALLAGAIRLLLLWASTRLSFAAGSDLSIGIYRRTLYQTYSVHVSRNSSEVIAGISIKANGVIYTTIMPILTLLSSSVMLVSILSALLYLDPDIAILTFIGFGFIYAFIAWFTRKQKTKNGQNIARESTQVIKSLQEGLGGIRDVLIDGSQEVYCRAYRKADLQLRQAQGSNQFLAQSPRYGMEALGMVLIASLAYALIQESDGVAKVIPVLGVFALGAQRLLPVMQQAYASWSTIQGSQASLQDALDLLDQPLPTHIDEISSKSLKFQNQIYLNQLSFRYSETTPWVFQELDLKITKGSRVGFIGITGSGKSTLLDVIMGLLPPTNGQLEVDKECITLKNQRSWHSHIAHVPQAIFLSDGTIEENIAFGVPKELIDSQRVVKSAGQAQIAQSIESWPNRYQTLVGERGIRLSGGQRQRIGIARALYKQADVIILDEATSALDNETEEAVMDAIDNLSADLTILIVAHRITTLRNCSKIVKLNHGRIESIYSYPDLLSISH